MARDPLLPLPLPLRQRLAGGAHHLRQALRIAPGRPAAMLGVRAALATAAPLLLASHIGHIAAAWASTGGFVVALADKGGAYRMRALTLGSVTVAGTLSVVAGALAGLHDGSAIALMLVWATVCAFAGALGPAAAAAGVSVAVLFAISLAWPAAAGDALVRAGAVLGGGAWASLLALLFWPVRVYRPARFAVGRVTRALASLAAELAQLPVEGHWSAHVPRSHGAIREALEAARAVLAATRRGQKGETGRGARLLVLLQICDSLFAALIALEEVLESAMSAAAPGALAPAMASVLGGVSASLGELAGRIETEDKLPPAPPLDWGADDLRAALPAAGAARAQWEHAAALVVRLRALVEIALETSGTLYDQRPATTPAWPAAPPDALPRPGELIRENLTWASVHLRHALRVGVTSAFAVAVVRATGLPRGYWVTITVIILLQPYTPATFVKTLQRVCGTVAGGIVAALLVAALHDANLVLALAIVLAGISAAVLQLNYALFSFLITPTFVLLAEAGSHDWHLAEMRIVNTILGGTLAFAGARLLWPRPERAQFPDELARALAAADDYLSAVAAVVAAQVPPPAPQLTAARRRLGLALNRADASYERLLSEHAGGGGPAQEPMMTMLLYTRRFGTTLGASASARAIAPAAAYAAAFARFAEAAQRLLDGLAVAVRERLAPPPLPSWDEVVPGDQSLMAARLGRLAQHLTVLHQAALRWADHSQGSTR